MAPRRNRVNNEADPAVTVVVAQAAADLLPTLTARITDEIRQNENNGNNINRRNARRVNTEGSGNDGDAQPTDIHFKARLATYKLEGDAHSWWRAYKQAKGGDAYVATLSWNDFRDIFFLQYSPYSKKEKLAGLLGAKAGTQEEHAKHFKWGLNDFVLDRILNTEFTDVAQAANAARNIEIFRDRDRYGNRGRHGNRDRYGTDRWRSDRQGSDRHGNGSDRQGNGKACHMVTGACFECEEVGHLAKDCKKGSTSSGEKRFGTFSFKIRH
ncbi:zinc finger, CCHC-type, retrotransposon gag domain protein [Tanacetum coccineum]